MNAIPRPVYHSVDSYGLTVSFDLVVHASVEQLNPNADANPTNLYPRTTHSRPSSVVSKVVAALAAFFGAKKSTRISGRDGREIMFEELRE